MEIKIIFVDLDLTLLRSDATISEYTKSVFKKCQEKGILVGFCTSRGTTRIQKYADIIHPDIGMLKTTGKGVAMGNAIPEVKAVVNEVTLSCDEDGVAVYLEKNIL